MRIEAWQDARYRRPFFLGIWAGRYWLRIQFGRHLTPIVSLRRVHRWVGWDFVIEVWGFIFAVGARSYKAA